MAAWEGLDTLAERLRWVREEVLKLPNVRAAERLFDEILEGVPAEERPKGTSWASVERYETGERVPNVDWAVLLAGRAGVNLTWLMTGAGGPYEVPGSLASRQLDLVRRIVEIRAPDEAVAREAEQIDALVSELEKVISGSPVPVRQAEGGGGGGTGD